jgi:hypothetical protein
MRRRPWRRCVRNVMRTIVRQCTHGWRILYCIRACLHTHTLLVPHSPPPPSFIFLCSDPSSSVSPASGSRGSIAKQGRIVLRCLSPNLGVCAKLSQVHTSPIWKLYNVHYLRTYMCTRKRATSRVTVYVYTHLYTYVCTYLYIQPTPLSVEFSSVISKLKTSISNAIFRP